MKSAYVKAGPRAGRLIVALSQIIKERERYVKYVIEKIGPDGCATDLIPTFADHMAHLHQIDQLQTKQVIFQCLGQHPPKNPDKALFMYRSPKRVSG